MLQSADASEPALAARRKVAWGFVSGHSKGHAATQLLKALLTVATDIRAKTKAQSNQAFGFDERIVHRFVVMRAWQVDSWCKCQTCLKALWKLTTRLLRGSECKARKHVQSASIRSATASMTARDNPVVCGTQRPQNEDASSCAKMPSFAPTQSSIGFAWHELSS